MSGYEFGVGYISVLPETSKIAPGIKKAFIGAEKDAKTAGKNLGSGLADGVKSGLQDAVKASNTSGKKMGDGISAGVKKGAQDASKAVKGSLDGAVKDSQGTGRSIGNNISGGIRGALTGVQSSVRRTVAGAMKESSSIASDGGATIGTRLGGGIVGGVQIGVDRARTLISGLVITAGVAAGGVGLFGIKTAAGFEQTQIGFETLLKSSDRAKSEMSWLTTTAAVTPFETKDLADTDKMLVNFGFTSDDLRHKWVNNLGNMAAAVGLPGDRLKDMGKVIGQVSSSGTAQLEDINQMADAGIPIWEMLSTHTGKSIKSLRDDISKGKLDSTTFFAAMDSYTGKNFNGAMEKQSKTVAGMWSSIKDNFALGAVGMVTPLLPIIKQYMPALSSAMTWVGENVAKAMPHVVDFFRNAVTGGQGLYDLIVKGDFTGKLSDVFGWKEDSTTVDVILSIRDGFIDATHWVKDELLPRLVTLGTWFVDNKATIAEFAAAVAIAATAFETYRGITIGLTAATWLYTFATSAYAVAMGVATEAQIAFNTAQKANLIGLIVVALAALVFGLIYAYNHFEGFRNLVNAVWAGIQAVISFAWNNVIKPVFTAIGWFITTVLVPVFKGIWTAVSWYFTLIGGIIVGIWNRVIYPLFQFWSWVIVNYVGKPVQELWNKVISPVFTWIGKKISDIWDKVKPVLQTMGDFITDTVGPAIKTGVDKIAGIWDTLQDIFLTPINFLIGTVYNEGIRKVINALPGVDDVEKMGLLGKPNAKGPLNSNGGHTPGFALGGAVRGFGRKGKDSINAMLAPGEHVWTAKEVDAAGGQSRVEALRKAVLRGGLGKTFDPPAFAGGGSLSSESIARAKKFAQDNVGDPYVWGGVGPNGFDCSGLMSAITNVITGKNPYSRIGATGNFPWSGFEAGPGQFTIGSTNNFGGSGIGHMAGTLDGLNVESRGGQGTVIGANARGYKDSGFNTVAHLGSSDTGGILSAITGVLKGLTGWISELANMGGFGGLISQVATKVVHDVADFAKSKASFGIFDDGGILEPGGIAYNASKKPEAVFNQKQFSQYANNAQASGTTRAEFTITNWKTGEGYFREIAGEEIDDAGNYAASGNRRNR